MRKPSRFTLTRRSAGLLLAAAMAILAGCNTLQDLILPAPRTEVLREAANRPRASLEIDIFLGDRAKSILADPKEIRLLRGTSVGVALLSLGSEGEDATPLIGSFQGDRRFPAGNLAALPYAAYYFANLNRTDIRNDDELRSAVVRMLRRQDHIAFNEVVDAISETESGPPLEGKAFEEFQARRYAINNWLAAIDLHPPLRVGQKIWEIEPFGRDIQLLGADYRNENIATATETARLMLLAIDKRLTPGKEAGALLELLSFEAVDSPEASKNLILRELPPSVVDVAGISSAIRKHHHNVVAFTLPDGSRFILTILTDRDKAGREFTRRMTREVLQGIANRELPIPRGVAAP